MPTHASGQLLLGFGGIDGIQTPVTVDTGASGSAWTIAQDQITGITGVVFWMRATTAAHALTLIPGVTGERANFRVVAISGAGDPSWTFALSAAGGATNADPPNHAAPGAAKNLWIACRANDAQIANTGYPANYTQGQYDISATSAAGASISWAERELEAASDDPSAYTTATEQWVAATIVVPPA
jgi:hypothetical protein